MFGQPRSRSFSIYLIKRDIDDHKDALSNASLPHQSVKDGSTTIGELYVKQVQPHPPPWVSFFGSAIDASALKLTNATTSGVLFVKVKKQWCAVTFGYGWTILKPQCIDEHFGLRVTLNAVDPAKIRSVDRITFDAIAQHSQIQASKESEIGDFGLDVEQDMLRAVTGTPSDLNLGKPLSGKDGLHTTLRIKLSELPETLKKFVGVGAKDTYKKNFPWVDNIQETRDPVLRETLDSLVIERIRKQEFENIWLAPPERMEWKDISGFKYGNGVKATLHNDLHIRDLFNVFGTPKAIDKDGLVKRHIRAIRRDSDEAAYQWTAYRCIYAEISRKGNQYLLNNGSWYVVAKDFRASIEASFQNLPRCKRVFPVYDDVDEETYNQRVEDEDRNTFACMDQKFIKVPDGRNNIEFCDLYTGNREMIHVKRYGASAQFSHLFAQGLVSATLFRGDPIFRADLNRKLPKKYRLASPTDPPVTRNFTVVYAIVSSSAKPLHLPFFSKVNLRNAARRLSDLGYKVQLAKIDYYR